jgi:hypothetical protein
VGEGILSVSWGKASYLYRGGRQLLCIVEEDVLSFGVKTSYIVDYVVGEDILYCGISCGIYGLISCGLIVGSLVGSLVNSLVGEDRGIYRVERGALVD